MFWFWLSTLGLAGGLLFTRWLHHFQGLPLRLPPRGAVPPLPPAPPAIAVAVPARNEARNIERCVTALLAQTYPNFTLTVLDDRSTDATPTLLAALAERDPRLRVKLGAPLPPGWAGKPHALTQAVAGAQAEWLCFVDADTFAEPHLLAAAFTAASAAGADLFTILTRQRLGTFWEKTVMPLVFTALTVGFPPRHVNDPRRPEAIANGQFILIRRAVYEALGGHAALRASITEDKDLALAVKRGGYRLLFADGRAAAETRMYTSLAELWEGWTKNIFLGLQGRPHLLLLGMATGLSGALVLTGWPLAGLVWVARGGSWPAAGVVAQALALWAYIVRQRARVLRELELSPAWSLTLPLGALVFAGMMFTSTLRVLTGRGVTWKGRRYAAAGPSQD